ncbi:DUF188 domain-containing protein [Treponema rectale]|uniref:UPF0178 protein DYE49_07520 n=1 Tax=Treponema rectale TaxID=744512 RepID=A0A840SEU9_9SPIR|nr:DUF188 domain-containing protein [Treponema rectale]MBB5217971.1 hypothetical protein [Treponema rectale]QOS40312.1 DUF188 domain-containing protein [Treponema rectale]
MNETKIWVDADNCPQAVREVILNKAKSFGLKVTYAANRIIPFAFEDPLFTMHVCPETAGAADDYIVSQATEDDIVITKDIPLAQRLIDRKITVINDRGTVFDQKKIQYMMEERELSMQMAALGLKKGAGWSVFGKKELAAFSKTFCNILYQKGYKTPVL